MIDSMDLRIQQEERTVHTVIRPVSVTIFRNPTSPFARLYLSGAIVAKRDPLREDTW